MRAIPERQQAKLTPVAAAALSQLCALFYYRSWLLQLSVPLDLGGDSLQKLQLVSAASRHGWILHNPSIGLPGQAQHLDFPRYDSLNYALIKLFAWLSGDCIVATNLYFLLGYGLIAFSACWVLQRLGIGAAWSIVGGLGYAWLPYHQLRGFHHFTNSAYWLVPLAVWFVRRVWYPPPGTAFDWRSWVFWLAFGVVIELQNPYYAIFFVALAGSVAVLLGATRGFRASRVPLVQTGVVIGVVVLTLVLEQLPRWMFEAAQGKNALALVRPLNGPSEYALSLADLLNPSPDHPIPWLARWTQHAAWVRGIKANERVVSTLPLLGLIGLVAGLLALVQRARRLDGGGETARLRQWAGALVLVALLWCHEGGICTLLAEAGFGQVRAWNRMVTYIAFAAVVAAASFLDDLGRRQSERRRRWLLGVVGLLVMGEQLFAAPRSSFTASAARWNEARQLTSELTSDGKLHRAFVFPFIEYPEAGKTGTISDYDHFLLAIASDKLAISYGSMRGRGAHYYSSAANYLKGAELAGYLRDAGFDLLVVDTFSTATAALRAEIATALGAPSAKSARFLAYRIAPPRAAPPSEAQWRAYALGTTLNFRDVATRRYLELNFSGFEPDGTWTIGKLATLRLDLPTLPAKAVLTIQGELFEDPKKRQRVQVLFDGQPACALERFKVDPARPHEWTCHFAPRVPSAASTTREIRFQVQYPTSPVMLKQSADDRLLGLRLVSLSLDADASQ